MANVKEFYIDPASGQIEIEYDNGTVRKFGAADTVVQDPTTGELKSPAGNLRLGSSGLSSVTYDGSSKVTGFTFSGVTYTVTYPANQIVVTGSDTSVQTISLDGSGRIQGVV